MRDVFHQLYYHVVWATKDRQPQMPPPVRAHLLAAIRTKCSRLGCIVHAVNAVDDHVHLALEIPPMRSVSSVVGQIKGASAYEMNQLNPGSLQWQEGYGVLTFRHAELQKVKQYIATQEERHRRGALSALLEADQEECQTPGRPPTPQPA
jgi:putative transposase